MIRLVIGTHGSGKSALAENLAMKTGDPFRIYLATMKVLDDEGKERVARHRRQREGKGFVTIEKEYGICDILERIEKPMETTLLLECVANLVGNEMYDNPKHGIVADSLFNSRHPDNKKDVIDRAHSCRLNSIDSHEKKENRKTGKEDYLSVNLKCREFADDIAAIADEIAAEIKKLSEGVHNTILVTNEYEQDSESYDEETRLYVQLLGMVNERIAKFSDEVFDLNDLSLYEKESEV